MRTLRGSADFRGFGSRFPRIDLVVRGSEKNRSIRLVRKWHAYPQIGGRQFAQIGCFRLHAELRLAPIGSAVMVTCRQLYHNLAGIVSPFLVNRFRFFFREMKAKISIYHTITRTCKSDKKCTRPQAKLDVENLSISKVTCCQTYHYLLGIFKLFLGSV